MAPEISATHQWIITDCGSTTSKTILFSRDVASKTGWHLEKWSVHPTTVEKPFDDVTVGVKSTFASLGLSSDQIQGSFLATSSAGGGLRLCIVALTKEISSIALQQAALHAGAIICGTTTLDDELSDQERILRMKNSKPDIILVAGGFAEAENPAISALFLILRESAPKSRFGEDIKIPLIYAGSSRKSAQVSELSDLFEVSVVAPIIPSAATQNQKSTEEKIHDSFLYSVMQHAPGYRKLSSMTAAEILPTPLAVTRVLESLSQIYHQSVLCIDMGGATTDVFSVDKNGAVHRSVSSNIGMSYSAVHVLQAAGVKALLCFLPDGFSAEEVVTSVYNKMIRPTTHPQDDRELLIEHALARVGIALAMKAHETTRRNEAQQSMISSVGISSIFDQNKSAQKIPVETVIASGGVFSHCPKMEEVPWMLADGLSATGICEIMLDRLFMLPHLGVLSTVDAAASASLLQTDCLETLGTLVVLKSYLQRNKVAAKDFTIVINRNYTVSLPASENFLVYAHREPITSIEVTSKVYIHDTDGTRTKKIIRSQISGKSNKVFIKMDQR